VPQKRAGRKGVEAFRCGSNRQHGGSSHVTG
jgi:hypothetical protein